MAYETYRVEVTRDETLPAGGVSVEITAYIDRMPETHDYTIGMLTPGAARRVEQPAAIRRRFRDIGRGAGSDRRRLSGNRPHPLLRIHVDNEFPVEVPPLVRSGDRWRPAG